MIELLWPNGEVSSGETWRDVEDSVRSSQWSPYKTRAEFRREMRRRALVWSGQTVRTGRTSESFIKALGAVNMFMIVEDGDVAE